VQEFWKSWICAENNTSNNLNGTTLLCDETQNPYAKNEIYNVSKESNQDLWKKHFSQVTQGWKMAKF
jgi:hypothetical protein